MIRIAKVLVWLLVLPVAGGLVATSLGIAEPYLAPSALPVTPTQGVLAGFGVAIAGVVASRVLDTLAWRRMGAKAGLSADGFVGNPTLTGTVRGRRIRVRTEESRDSEDQSHPPRTVVETDLETPVEWTAMFAPAEHAEMAHLRYLETDEDDWTTIGEVAVWGPLTEEQARDVLTASVRNALRGLESGVIVGDVGQEVERQMATAIEESAEGTDGLADEFIDTSAADGDPEPARQVSHQEWGLLTDSEELERRVQAVAAVAEAVEVTSVER